MTTPKFLFVGQILLLPLYETLVWPLQTGFSRDGKSPAKGSKRGFGRSILRENIEKAETSLERRLRGDLVAIFKLLNMDCRASGQGQGD